ncbi:MAG: hypothetical protein ACLR0N_15410 [Bilophila wadsworthia]
MTKERRRCPVRHLRQDLGESTAHILQMKKANAVEDRDTAFYNRAYEEHKRPQRWTAKISGPAPPPPPAKCPPATSCIAARTIRSAQTSP